MGGSESTPAPIPPSLEFDEPWRETPWEKKKVLEKNLRELKLSDPKVKYVRILLTGEIAAGKSSFINSVNSTFQGRITSEALADADTGTSFTKTYRTYYIRDGESALPFVFNDIMGLEAGESHGAHQEDIAKCLEGLLKEGYNFNPAVSAENKDCRSTTSTEDLTYCLVYVIAADKVSMMHDEVFKKMRYIRQKASSLEIPQAIIMTKVDEICPLVRKDLRKIYTSKKIKEKMQQCSNSVGVPMSHIFPVKNYHEEIDEVNCFGFGEGGLEIWADETLGGETFDTRVEAVCET
ncbi:interferon-induced 44-like protein [Labeo rohita]|uniref:Interferon-induced 44-like protein n=1 Tax=Labeo rohita TaxID=84645 RepID=A0A498P136_LABRO|nr:interferon-induced 44-like protein [Labeo rohita]